MKRACIYARASTEKQTESTNVQIERAKVYIEKQGWVLVHVFEDEALSRAEYVKRPELFAMLNAANRHEFDVIVLRDLDRLGGDTNRNGVILSDLNDSGVSVHEYKSGGGVVQIDGAIGKLMAVVKSFAAEIEREKTAQRTHEALSSKATKGHAVGGVRYGHKNVPIFEGGKRVRTEIAIDEQQGPIVLEIWRRHWVDGDGYRTIALDLNARGVPSPRAGKRGMGAWSHRLIFEISHNVAYLGQITYGVHKKTYRLGTKTRVRRDASEVQVMEMPHLRIIPVDIERAMRRHMSKQKPSSLLGRGKKPAHLLSGIARCGTCGGPMQARLAKGHRVYYCGRHNDCGPTVCSNGLRRPLDEADRSVVGWITRNVLDEEIVQAIFKQVQRRIRERSKATASEIPRMEKELAKLQSEATKLAQAIAMTGGRVDALATTIQEKQERIRTLEARLALLKSAPNVLAMEATRLEKETRARLGDLHAAIHGDVAQGRRVISALMPEGMKFIPTEADDGPEYKIEGRVVLGNLLEAGTGSVRFASPAGFEPALQP